MLCSAASCMISSTHYCIMELPPMLSPRNGYAGWERVGDPVIEINRRRPG